MSQVCEQGKPEFKRAVQRKAGLLSRGRIPCPGGRKGPGRDGMRWVCHRVLRAPGVGRRFLGWSCPSLICLKIFTVATMEAPGHCLFWVQILKTYVWGRVPNHWTNWVKKPVQADVVKACLQYRGTPDPLKGPRRRCCGCVGSQTELSKQLRCSRFQRFSLEGSGQASSLVYFPDSFHLKRVK